MKLLPIAILLLLFSVSFAAQKCDCKKAAPDEQTRWGGNENISFREKKTYRRLCGFVHAFADNSRMANVLVEIYDRPDYLLAKTYQPPDARQRRIAACVTGADGAFCFDSVAAGHYELRTSLGISWNVSHVYVVVNPKSRKSSVRPISVAMMVGT